MKTGRGNAQKLPAGGPASHVPVLLHETMSALALKSGGRYIDGTFGAGGYTRSILEHADTSVLALDRDPNAIRDGAALAADYAGRLLLGQARFSALAEQARGHDFLPVDGVALDIGVSSMQIDQAERGFSFRFDGPLDMRMEGRGECAADIVNTASAERLADIIYYYGEDRAARRIARAIVAARVLSPIDTTQKLAELVQRANPGKPTDIHPATRTFQGLRIAVNDELGELVRALTGAESILAEGGVLAVVTFHSLEDRIVKQFFASRSGRGMARSRLLPGEPVPPPATFEVAGRQPVTPDYTEIAANPRARSAKLRFGVRTAAAARGMETRLLEAAALPDPEKRKR